jgi:hypothetical protein
LHLPFYLFSNLLQRKLSSSLSIIPWLIISLAKILRPKSLLPTYPQFSIFLQVKYRDLL